MKPRFPLRFCQDHQAQVRPTNPGSSGAGSGWRWLLGVGGIPAVRDRPPVGGCNFLFSIHGSSESGGFQPILFGIGRLSWTKDTKDRIKIDSLANFSCLAQASRPPGDLISLAQPIGFGMGWGTQWRVCRRVSVRTWEPWAEDTSDLKRSWPNPPRMLCQSQCLGSFPSKPCGLCMYIHSFNMLQATLTLTNVPCFGSLILLVASNDLQTVLPIH